MASVILQAADSVVPRSDSTMRAIGINPERDFDLTYDQVSTMSGLSARTLRALVAAGDLGCVRHNAKVVTIPLEEWRRYRESRRERVKIRASAAIRHDSAA